MLDWKVFQHNLLELGFTLNNREWAGLFWLSVFAIWTLSHKGKRFALMRVLRTLLRWKVFISLLAFLAWIAIVVWIGASVTLWRWALTKDTILWILTTGIVSFFSYRKASKPHYFRHGVIGAISATVLVEYFINLAVFSLWVEFIMQFVVALLVGISVVAQSRKEYQKISLMMNCLLVGIMLGLLIHTGSYLYFNRRVVQWNELGLRAIMPIWLSFGLLPYVRLFGLIANYELAFIKLDLAARDRHAPWWAKLALLSKLRLKSSHVHAAACGGTYEIANATSFSEARQATANFQELLREKNRMERERQKRLVRYVGSQETDANGRQLDRREFEETMRALRWLASCQMGWYRRENRYREDLLMNILGNDFTRQGLPRESGIMMRVSEDGQSWYAWRCTVTGWCFAIGASGPPPNQWTYDGPEPPSGFPGEDPAWGDAPFSLGISPNWD